MFFYIFVEHTDALNCARSGHSLPNSNYKRSKQREGKNYTLLFNQSQLVLARKRKGKERKDQLRCSLINVVAVMFVDVQVHHFVKLDEVYYAGSHGMDILGPAKQLESDDRKYQTKTLDNKVCSIPTSYIFIFNIITL